LSHHVNEIASAIRPAFKDTISVVQPRHQLNYGMQSWEAPASPTRLDPQHWHSYQDQNHNTESQKQENHVKITTPDHIMCY
jgi:hypothetical protein